MNGTSIICSTLGSTKEAVIFCYHVSGDSEYESAWSFYLSFYITADTLRIRDQVAVGAKTDSG